MIVYSHIYINKLQVKMAKGVKYIGMITCMVIFSMLIGIRHDNI